MFVEAVFRITSEKFVPTEVARITDVSLVQRRGEAAHRVQPPRVFCWIGDV